MTTSAAHRRVGTRQLTGVLAALALLALHAPEAADGAVAAAPALAGAATLTASSADLAGLVFAGVTTVETTAGSVETLELTSSAAALADLRLRPACTPIVGLGTGMTTESTTAEQSISRAPGGLTLFAAALTATTAEGTVTWTPDSPPPASELGDVSLTNVSVQIVSLQAPQIVLPGLRQASLYC